MILRIKSKTISMLRRQMSYCYSFFVFFWYTKWPVFLLKEIFLIRLLGSLLRCTPQIKMSKSLCCTFYIMYTNDGMILLCGFVFTGIRFRTETTIYEPILPKFELYYCNLISSQYEVKFKWTNESYWHQIMTEKKSIASTCIEKLYFINDVY